MATKPNYQSTNVVLFDKYGIRIYAIELPDDTPRRGPGRMLAERAAVKHLLREAFPGDRAISIGHLPSGAPFLTYADDPEGEDDCRQSDMPSISISHCTRMAALAIGTPGMRLGIDCESGDRLASLQRTAPRFLSHHQMDQWGNYPATLWAWCIKEAAYKAAGQPGLALPWIPLPLEIPLEETTADAVISIDDILYNVVQVDTLDRPAILMLVFAAAPADNE